MKVRILFNEAPKGVTQVVEVSFTSRDVRDRFLKALRIGQFTVQTLEEEWKTYELAP